MTYTVSSGTLNSTIPYHTIGLSSARKTRIHGCRLSDTAISGIQSACMDIQRVPYRTLPTYTQDMKDLCWFSQQILSVMMMMIRFAHGGNMRCSNMSVFCFSSISSALRRWTMRSRLSAYFSSLCSIQSIMSNFLQHAKVHISIPTSYHLRRGRCVFAFTDLSKSCQQIVIKFSAQAEFLLATND